VWRKPEHNHPSSPSENASGLSGQQARSVAGLTAEMVQPSGGMVTSTILIKGEIRGREDLYIDGEVQGVIELTDGRVTIGPHGRIAASAKAREIVVRGTVNGKLDGRDRVEIGRTGEVRGDIVTSRIAIEDGAVIHSNVEVIRAGEQSWSAKV